MAWSDVISLIRLAVVLVLFVLCVALLWESFYFHVSSCLFSCFFFVCFVKTCWGAGGGHFAFLWSVVCVLSVMVGLLFLFVSLVGYVMWCVFSWTSILIFLLMVLYCTKFQFVVEPSRLCVSLTISEQAVIILIYEQMLNNVIKTRRATCKP